MSASYEREMIEFLSTKVILSREKAEMTCPSQFSGTEGGGKYPFVPNTTSDNKHIISKKRKKSFLRTGDDKIICRLEIEESHDSY